MGLGVAGAGVAGAGVEGLGVAGLGVAGFGVAGVGVLGAGVAGLGVAGFGVAGFGVAAFLSAGVPSGVALPSFLPKTRLKKPSFFSTGVATARGVETGLGAGALRLTGVAEGAGVSLKGVSNGAGMSTVGAGAGSWAKRRGEDNPKRQTSARRKVGIRFRMDEKGRGFF